jgi:DNA-directed RNA polymerase specialized sigma24 family protein
MSEHPQAPPGAATALAPPQCAGEDALDRMWRSGLPAEERLRAWAEWLSKGRVRLGTYAARWLRRCSSQDAEDILQEVFIRLRERVLSGKRPPDWNAYVLRAIRNRCISDGRSDRARGLHERAKAEAAPPEQPDLADYVDEVREALEVRRPRVHAIAEETLGDMDEAHRRMVVSYLGLFGETAMDSLAVGERDGVSPVTVRHVASQFNNGIRAAGGATIPGFRSRLQQEDLLSFEELACWPRGPAGFWGPGPPPATSEGNP